MTERARIGINVTATYLRSLYALALGIFTARWALKALGDVDYGLYGLIGGLVGFVAFFNTLLSGAVGRFFAYSVGKSASVDESVRGSALQECREWFSIAVVLHLLVSISMVSMGYPIGIWLIKSYLTIPEARIADCIWVWRYSCASCFVGMVSVPFSAMYTAKQNIAELTLYSFFSSTVNAVALYYFVTHEGCWLRTYALVMCLIVVGPQIVMMVRAGIVFAECRLVGTGLFDFRRYRELFGFVGARFVCMVSQLCSTHCLSIVVNKFMGPAKNATMTLANVVNAHTGNLSSALSSAFMPAITNAAGAGDFVKMRMLAFKTSKFGTMAFLAFSIPLFLELDKVLTMWLEKPPEGMVLLCAYLLICSVVERLGEGFWIAIFAIGNITRFQLVESVAYFGTLALAIFLAANGCDIWCIGVSLLAGKLFSLAVKLWYGRSIAGMQFWVWVKTAFLPVLGVLLVTSAFGVLPAFLLGQSFARVVCTTLMCEVAFLPAVWYFVLSSDERQYVVEYIKKKVKGRYANSLHHA